MSLATIELPDLNTLRRLQAKLTEEMAGPACEAQAAFNSLQASKGMYAQDPTAANMERLRRAEAEWTERERALNELRRPWFTLDSIAAMVESISGPGYISRNSADTPAFRRAQAAEAWRQFVLRYPDVAARA